jgi:IS1 family transposase/transposase-like protein
MVQVSLRCPFCGSEHVTKNGSSNGKQRYKCHNTKCTHQTFYAEYTYNGCKADVKPQIIKMAINGNGIRATARILNISPATVISTLKKKETQLSYVNKEYIAKRTKGRIPLKIRVEIDEMWSFYHNKGQQIWLWWAIDHDTGEVIAFWFGTREHNNLDELMKLLSPLSIGRVFSDGNEVYSARFSSEVLLVSKHHLQKIERKHLSLRTWCSRLVRKGIRFSKTSQMHKIAVGLVINVWYFGYNHLIQ